MKRKNMIMVIVSVLILVIFFVVIFTVPYFKPINSNVNWQDNKVSKNEELLLNFIENKLTNDDGSIKTNYKDIESDGDITKGKAVLSESEGMLLLYYLDRNEEENFDNVLAYIKEKMMLESGLISWRVIGEKKADTSATIDDLRIIKALLLASERWNKITYRNTAFKISRGIKKNLLDNNLLVDYYDGNEKANKTTICYLDIRTLSLLSNLDYSYKKVYENSLDLINKSYLGDEVPLYSKEYDRINKSFDDEDADMLLSSIILLNKLQCGEDISISIEWIKSKYKIDGGIFATYDSVSGETTSNIESTSIYAILFQIAEKLNDDYLYNICLEKLKGYQVMDELSEVYGSYGNSNTLDVYSYDNLNALLAWRKFKDNN